MNKRFAFLRPSTSPPTARQVGVGTLALAVVFFVYNLITAYLDPVWQQWLFAGVSAVFLVATVVAYMWMKEGRVRAAGWLLILAMQVLTLTIVVLYTDMALLAAMVAAIYALLLAPQTLPRQEVAGALFLGLLIGTSIYVFDFFTPLPRTAPLSPTTGWILAILLAAFYASTLTRQFPNLDLRTRFMFSTLLGATLIIASLITYFLNSNTRNATIAAQEKLAFSAIQTAQEIDNFLSGTLELARTGAALPTVQEYVTEEERQPEDLARVETLLQRLRSTNPAFIQSYTLVNFRGDLLAIAPAGIQRDAFTENLDTAYALRSQLEDAFITPIEAGPSGRSTLAFVARVSDESGVPVGALIVRYSADILQNIIAAHNESAGARSFALLVDNNQVILGHGLSAQKRLQTLSGLSGKSRNELRDLGLRNFIELPLTGDTTIIDVAAIRGISNRPWHVLFAQPQDAFLAPVKTQARTSSAIALFFLFGTAIGAFVMTNYLVSPLVSLTRTAERVAAGDLSVRAPVLGEDEIGTLARTFNTTTERLQHTLNSLERQVEERTQALQKRSHYLRASAEVAAAITTILDMDVLIRQVVNTIKARFGLYYVGLFLVDASGQWAVLRAGTGLAGEKMLAREHRIRVGDGMIGWSILHGEPRIAQIATEDAVRLTAPELPLTRSEAALPLRSRGRVLGALTVQSDNPNAFDEDILAILQIMADQVAAALDNARVFRESEQALQAARRAFGEFTRKAWRDMLRSRPNWGYRYQEGRLAPVAGDWPEEMRRALREGRPIHGRDARGPLLTLPLLVRGNPIGVLQFRKPPQALDWASDEIQTMQDLAAQLALSLDNARLYEDNQQRAFQEQVRGEIISRLRQQNDLERVLTAAAEEIYSALALEEITIQLVPPDTNGASAHE